jgi:hypothetical protein
MSVVTTIGGPWTAYSVSTAAPGRQPKFAHTGFTHQRSPATIGESTSSPPSISMPTITAPGSWAQSAMAHSAVRARQPRSIIPLPSTDPPSSMTSTSLWDSAQSTPTTVVCCPPRIRRCSRAPRRLWRRHEPVLPWRDIPPADDLRVQTPTIPVGTRLRGPRTPRTRVVRPTASPRSPDASTGGAQALRRRRPMQGRGRLCDRV